MKAHSFPRMLFLLTCVSFTLATRAESQTIHQYTVKHVLSPLQIDGQLTEPEWQAAALTEKFIHHTDGTPARLSTQAKFLWDSTYLYIGFFCEDPDVWATMKNRDESLYKGEVVEMICDPDGDGLNYFEVQVNPLKTIFDLRVSKAYNQGGVGDATWNLKNIKVGVWVDGTLNDSTDVDKQWTCEVALPFAELAIMATGMSIPPANNDVWRIQVSRYFYPRTGSPELSAWDQTNNSSFHIPPLFGKLIFSTGSVLSSAATERGTRLPLTIDIKNFPNPFNPSTTVALDVPEPTRVVARIFDLLGHEVATLVDERMKAGSYRKVWDAKDNSGKPVAAGVYFVRMQTNDAVILRKILLLR